MAMTARDDELRRAASPAEARPRFESDVVVAGSAAGPPMRFRLVVAVVAVYRYRYSTVPDNLIPYQHGWHFN